MKTKIELSDNELIAQFMGVTPTEKTYLNLGTWYNMKFNTSWDWLMPVVEKIAKYYYQGYQTNNGYKNITEYDYAYPRTFGMLNGGSGKFMVRINRMTLHEDESLIKATYEAVIEFIKWYNEN